jgi:3-oxoacyl-[acyl-carrier protein] reductase
MTGRLTGKTAIVTGGASGFGEGIVKKFISEGANVMIADINELAATTLSMSIGKQCAAFQRY